jgi:hypothetical protein
MSHLLVIVTFNVYFRRIGPSAHHFSRHLRYILSVYSMRGHRGCTEGVTHFVGSLTVVYAENVIWEEPGRRQVVLEILKLLIVK